MKIFLVKLFLTTAIVLLPTIVSGQMVITEVMYDLSGTDTGREWVEVKNEGGEEVDLTTWKFFEANTNHSLKISQGSQNLPSGSYAIISSDPSKFLLDWPSFSGVIFDSSFSLSNTGESISLRNTELLDTDTFSYTSNSGANGDGNSLHSESGTLKNGTPTPGGVFTGGTLDPASDDESGDEDGESSTSTPKTTTTNTTVSTGGLSSHSGPVPIRKATPRDPMSIYIGKDRITSVGNPIDFKAEAKNVEDKNDRRFRFSWSMGDGSLLDGGDITHHYENEGKYVVILNAKHGDDIAVARINVYVYEPNLSLSNSDNNGIKITNKSNEEINLYKWKISSANKKFEFPKDTIILGKESIVFPTSITEIYISEPLLLKLFNPQGKEYAFAIEKVEKNNDQIASRAKSSEISPTKQVQEIPLELEKSKAQENINSEKEITGVPKDSLVAGVSNVFVVEKPEGFFHRVAEFFSNIFN